MTARHEPRSSILIFEENIMLLNSIVSYLESTLKKALDNECLLEMNFGIRTYFNSA